MGKDDIGPIAQYNSLTDPYLQGYYSKSVIRTHLKQSGLISRKGDIIPEEVWRKRLVTKEKMQQASRMIANKIVQQAIEMKNLERAEIRRKLEEVAKKELVRRIRGQSVQNRQLPLLWANRNESEERNYLYSQKNDSRSLSPKSGNNDRSYNYDDLRHLDDSYHHGDKCCDYKDPGKKQKQKKRYDSKKRLTKLNRGYTVLPKQEPPPTMVTMYYYGKGVNIPFDTQVFEYRDEIMIYQQHCGGENLLVYSGLHKGGDKFEFRSKRHKEFPFSLTIYINGTYDCRVSTCCEFKHQLNVKIGGKSGRFAITNIVGGTPCIKCLLEKSDKKMPPINKPAEEEPENEDVEVIPERGTKANFQSGDNEKPQIEVKDSNDTTNYEDEFTDDTIQTDQVESPKTESPKRIASPKHENDKFTIKVFTSDLKGKSMEGTDANVYVFLTGSAGETSRIWLNRDNVISKNKDLFEAGNVDEFVVDAGAFLDQLVSIRIGHDDDDLGSGWHLNKVEIVNRKTMAFYSFPCGHWLSKDEEDGQIERVLTCDSKEKAAAAKIEIPVKHVEDSELSFISDLSKKKSSKPPSKESSRKASISSVKSTDSAGKKDSVRSARYTIEDIKRTLNGDQNDTFRSSSSSNIMPKTTSSSSRKASAHNTPKDNTSEDESLIERPKSSVKAIIKSPSPTKARNSDNIPSEDSEADREISKIKSPPKSPSQKGSKPASPVRSPIKSPVKSKTPVRFEDQEEPSYSEPTTESKDEPKAESKKSSPRKSESRLSAKVPSETDSDTEKNLSRIRSPTKSTKESKPASPVRSPAKSPTKSPSKSPSPVEVNQASRKSSAKSEPKQEESETVEVRAKTPSEKAKTPTKSPSPTKNLSRPESRVKSPSESLKKANQLLSSEDDTNNDTSELADASLSKGEEVILLPSRKQSHESTKSQKALDNTNIATSSNTNIRETTPSPTKSNHSKPRTTNTSPLEETKTSQKSLNNSLHSVREERPESKKSQRSEKHETSSHRSTPKEDRPESKKSNHSAQAEEPRPASQKSNKSVKEEQQASENERVVPVVNVINSSDNEKSESESNLQEENNAQPQESAEKPAEANEFDNWYQEGDLKNI